MLEDKTHLVREFEGLFCTCQWCIPSLFPNSCILFLSNDRKADQFSTIPSGICLKIYRFIRFSHQILGHVGTSLSSSPPQHPPQSDFFSGTSQRAASSFAIAPELQSKASRAAERSGAARRTGAAAARTKEPLVMTNSSPWKMDENGLFIDDFPINTSIYGFSMALIEIDDVPSYTPPFMIFMVGIFQLAMLVITRWYVRLLLVSNMEN